MKGKYIILLILGYFIILFTLQGTDKTNEKLKNSMKSVAPIILVLVVGYYWYRTRNVDTLNQQQENQNEIIFKIPDRFNYLENYDPKKAIDFGIKSVWIAIKIDQPKKVANYLKLTNEKAVNWIEGTVRAYQGDVFITPNLKGWTLIHGWGLPTPDSKYGSAKSMEFLNGLSATFKEAYLFGNNRVSGVAFWAKSINGELQRMYMVADGIGESIGKPTHKEENWNLVDLSPGSIAPPDSDWSKFKYPGEDEVIEMAEYWSIDPTQISQIPNVAGMGIVGRLKNHL